MTICGYSNRMRQGIAASYHYQAAIFCNPNIVWFNLKLMAATFTNDYFIKFVEYKNK